MKTVDMLRRAWHAIGQSLVVFLKDVGHGMLELGHNTLAVVGLAVVAALVFAAGRADIRHQAETLALEWLQTRQEARNPPSGLALVAIQAYALVHLFLGGTP